MPQMIVLAYKALEGSQLVGIPGLAGLDLDVKVAPEMRQVTLEHRNIH